MLQGWNSVMQTLRDAGIPVYVVIGNHELFETGGKISYNSRRIIRPSFPKCPRTALRDTKALPIPLPTATRFSSYSTPFIWTRQAGPLTKDPHIEQAQFDWAGKQTATANANPAVIHKFAFSHAPAFSDENNDYKQYNANLWTRLNNNGFDAFFGATNTSTAVSR